MNLNDLLQNKGVDPHHVVVLRHRPHEPELNEVLPWLAAEKPAVFNAYQQTQGARLEKVMASIVGSGHVASFIGHEPGRAVFVGIYSVETTKSITPEEYWEIPAYIEMKAFGMKGFTGADGRRSILWFDLALTELFSAWKGKLVVDWPPPERSWWRRAHRNDIPVFSIHEASILDASMPEWDAINLSWDDLNVLPSRWKSRLSQWRGVYYILDVSDGKGYVGSAYGEANLLGRWLNYASSGHGGNKLLKQRNPHNFRFTILQRVSPDMNSTDIIRLESSWKVRLHTRQPSGLNEN